jgi:RNA polymerase sigma-70 factor (sigma-E family)
MPTVATRTDSRHDQRGDESPHRPDTEFAEFVRARTQSLLRTGYLLTGDHHLAEDLVQSALARTHRAWKRLQHTGNAQAYTRKAMYHLQVSWWRRNRVAETLSETLSDTAASADTAPNTVLRLALHRALLKLTAKQRAVLVLRYFEQCSVEETAQTLGCAPGTVKSQTAKALARMRALAPDLSVTYPDEETHR